MGVLANLTPAQLKSLNDFDLLIRPSVIELFKAVREAQACANQYNATINTIIGLLDGTELLPTETGLAGATPFAEADWGFMISYLQAWITWHNANMIDSGQMVLWTKAAGSGNLLGQ